MDVVVDHVIGAITARGHRSTVGSLEHPAIQVVLLNREPALVYEAMMTGSKAASGCRGQVSPPADQCLTWCASTKRQLQQPGNAQPMSRAQSARLIVAGTVRVLRPTLSGSPSAFSRTTTLSLSQEIRLTDQLSSANSAPRDRLSSRARSSALSMSSPASSGSSTMMLIVPCSPSRRSVSERRA